MVMFRRILEWLATAYVLISVVVVSSLLLFPQSVDVWIPQPVSTPHSHSNSFKNLSFPSLDRAIAWPSYPLMRDRGIDSGGYVSTRTLLSKAFSSSLKPNHIVPFYYKSLYAQDVEDNLRKGKGNRDDITITTLVTPNRFQVLADLAEKYQGPISATVQIALPSSLETAASNSTFRDTLSRLHELYTTFPYLSSYVDIHLVLSPSNHSREFNLWRNIARLFATTTYVMMLDVDFMVCTDFRSRILLALSHGVDGPAASVIQRFREGRGALVVPAFEYRDQEEGKHAENFPDNRQALLSLVNDGKIAMFHRSWLPGHGSTDYDRYYAASEGQVYLVTKYQHSYEPYIIFKKDGPPWCDERFVGYGGNKAACIYEMYLWGMSFWVLSDDFLIHRSHGYEERVRAQERKVNRVVYNEFREESCLKYLRLMIETRTLMTPRGDNVLSECKKVRTVSGEVVKVSPFSDQIFIYILKLMNKSSRS